MGTREQLTGASSTVWHKYYALDIFTNRRETIREAAFLGFAKGQETESAPGLLQRMIEDATSVVAVAREPVGALGTVKKRVGKSGKTATGPKIT